MSAGLSKLSLSSSGRRRRSVSSSSSVPSMAKPTFFVSRNFGANTERSGNALPEHSGANEEDQDRSVGKLSRRGNSGCIANGGLDASASESESLILRLSKLESTRDEKRRKLERRFEEMMQIRKEINDMERELQDLDGTIEEVEGRIRTLASSTSTKDDDRGDDAKTILLLHSPKEENKAEGDGGGRIAKGAQGERPESFARVGKDLSTFRTLTCQPDELLTDPISPTRSQLANDLHRCKFRERGVSLSRKPSFGLTPPSPPPLRIPLPHDSFDEADIEEHYADQDQQEVGSIMEPDTEDIVSQYESIGLMPDAPPCTTSIVGLGGDDDIEFPLPDDDEEGSEEVKGTPCRGHFDGSVIGGNRRDESLGVENDTGRSFDPAAAMAEKVHRAALPSGLWRTEGHFVAKERMETVPPRSTAFSLTGNLNHQGRLHDCNMAVTTLDQCWGSSESAPSRSRPEAMLAAQDPAARASGGRFPWSSQVFDILRNDFRIDSFRDRQHEIIDCTLAGKDVFVIMRTGGGKSLTYQLPALLEGRYDPRRKVTVVVFPLLSLIHDQEEQMNRFCPGSALSFTSGLAGGQAEHARRWNLVRDPDGGVCLIFVTPEKVHKSNKLKNELQKLNDQGRLGRFVIDECHCACQWGFDFRPDYKELWRLKATFPDIPLMATTATASEGVREECARILRLSRNYKIFRSTFNRPNLNYSVRVKADGGRKVVDEMADFIKSRHPNHAGIVYTLSRKDADDVAVMLREHGIVAQSYHSDISNVQKERIHRSWMANKTKVVVATIAFGLGINKPDVRFVFHHCLSKSLEAYYQESGRAGRDGNPADCILFYSPRDVSRILCMIHGEHGESSYWSMVRYAQASGDDELCRAIIMSVLGEPGCQDVSELLKNGCCNTEMRDVGAHALTVTRIVRDACSASRGKRKAKDDLTLPQLVTAWRSKEPKCQYLRDNPPGKDLTKDECERVILCLMVECILQPKVVYNSYGSSMYVHLGPKAQRLLDSSDPHVKMRFPRRSLKTPTSKQKDRATSSKSCKTGSSGWISTKRSDPLLDDANIQRSKRTSTSNASPKRGGRKQQSKKRRRSTENESQSQSKKPSDVSPNESEVSEVILLDQSLSDCDDIGIKSSGERMTRERTAKRIATNRMKNLDPDFFDDSDEEN